MFASIQHINIIYFNIILYKWDSEESRMTFEACLPDTWQDTTPSHIILTLGRPVLALPRKSEPSEEQLVPFLTTLVCRGPGSNPWPPVPQSGHTTYWATGAGNLSVF